MSSRQLGEIEYKPYNLCCVLEQLFGRCTVCRQDLCKECFFQTHNKMGMMYCGSVRLYWKKMNFMLPSDPEKLELWPVGD
jgi:hypothetical protein